MYITTPGQPENSSILSQAEAPGATNRASDINFFNAQLSQTEPPVKGIVPAVASPVQAWSATASDALSRRVSKGFRDASLNKKTKDANEFPQSLAEAHIDVMSRVKVIGAVAKGVDKISSMG